MVRFSESTLPRASVHPGTLFRSPRPFPPPKECFKIVKCSLIGAFDAHTLVRPPCRGHRSAAVRPSWSSRRRTGRINHDSTRVRARCQPGFDIGGDQPSGVGRRQAGRHSDERGRPDCPALPDGCLFRLPAGAGPRKPGPGRHRGAAPRVHRHAAAGAARRLDRPGSGTDAAGGRGTREPASPVQVLQRGRRRHLPIVPGGSADRAGRAARRAGGADGEPAQLPRQTKSACWWRPRPRWRRWSARRALLDRFIATGAGAAVDAGPESVVELGQRLHQPVSRSGPAAVARSSITIRFRCSPRFPCPRSNGARETWCCTAGSTTPTAATGIPECGPHVGRDACGSPAAAAGGIFFGRVRPARIGAGVFRRAGRAGRRPYQERVRSGYSRWSGSGCSTGKAISASAWMRTGGSRKTTWRSDVSQLPMEPAIGKNGAAGDGGDRNAARRRSARRSGG